MTMMAMFAAALASATPAAAPTDPDMLCFVAMAAQSGQGSETREKTAGYDNAGGFYLAAVSKRYPTVALFTPALEAALSEVRSGDLGAISDKCLIGVQPSLDLVTKALDQLGK